MFTTDSGGYHRESGYQPGNMAAGEVRSTAAAGTYQIYHRYCS